MTDLKDYQFELDGYAFGLDLPISVDGDGFQPGAPAAEVQDQESAYGEATFFGIDRLQGPTWAWALHTDSTYEPEDALLEKRTLAKVWASRKTRRTRRAVLPLRYRLGGQTRRVYGRPRNFAASPSNGLINGYIPMACDFKLVEPYCYDDAPRDRVLTGMPPLGGGYVFDLVFPISTAAGEARVGMMTAEEVGGDEDTPFTAVIHGSITNPWISMGDWKIEVLGVVAHDQTVTISTYPWDLKAVRSDGTNMQLSTGTRLSSSLLSCDGGEVKFGGTSMSGTSRLDLSWRPRWSDW